MLANSVTKTVLVVEDDPVVRMIAAEMLTAAGFDVVEAEHAEKALEVLVTNSFSIQLLFTDIQMPGFMSGLELAHHVHTTWPHIGLLITSGESAPTSDHMPSGSIFIAKAYNLRKVIAHLHALSEC